MSAAARGRGAPGVLSLTWADLRSCWLAMAGAALLYSALAAIVLLPLIGVLFRFLIARTHTSAVADVDIARFLFTTAPGVVALILVTALIAAVTAIEQACLMCTGLGRARGVILRVRDAFEHAAVRAVPILGLTILFVVRLLILIVPYAVAIGVVYWILLRQYDINYYLTDRPTASTSDLMDVRTLSSTCVILSRAMSVNGSVNRSKKREPRGRAASGVWLTGGPPSDPMARAECAVSLMPA